MPTTKKTVKTKTRIPADAFRYKKACEAYTAALNSYAKTVSIGHMQLWIDIEELSNQVFWSILFVMLLQGALALLVIYLVVGG